MYFGYLFLELVIIIPSIATLNSNEFDRLLKGPDLQFRSRSDTPSIAAYKTTYYLPRLPKDDINIKQIDIPSAVPSDSPSTISSDSPSTVPSDSPSTVPSDSPSKIPSDSPSPSLLPSHAPFHSVGSANPTYIERTDESYEGYVGCIGSNTIDTNSSICYKRRLDVGKDISKQLDERERKSLIKFNDTFEYFKEVSPDINRTDCTWRWRDLHIMVVIKVTTNLYSMPPSFSIFYNNPKVTNTCDSIEVNGIQCISCEYCGNASFSADCTNVPFGRKFNCESIRIDSSGLFFRLYPLTVDAIKFAISKPYNATDLVHPDWLFPAPGSPC